MEPTHACNINEKWWHCLSAVYHAATVWRVDILPITTMLGAELIRRRQECDMLPTANVIERIDWSLSGISHIIINGTRYTGKSCLVCPKAANSEIVLCIQLMETFEISYAGLRV